LILSNKLVAAGSETTTFRLWAWLFSTEFCHLLKVVGTMVGVVFCYFLWLA